MTSVYRRADRRVFYVLSIFFSLLMGIAFRTLSPSNGFFLLVLLVFVPVSLITPLAGLVFLLILAPLRTLIATESLLSLPLDIGQILFFVYLGLWILERIIHRKPLPPSLLSPVYLPLIAFVFVIGLTVFTALSPAAWLTEWLKWVLILLMMVIIAESATSAKVREWIIAAVILAGFANACIGIYIFFGGSGALSLVVNGHFFRAFGTFGQPNPFGAFMGLLIPITLMMFVAYLYRAGRNYQTRKTLHITSILPVFFYGAASVTMVIAIVASWSRGAWLGVLAALAVSAFAFPRKLWQSLLITFSLLSLVGVLFLGGILPRSIIIRIASSTEEFFIFDDVRGVNVTPENFAVVERLSHWQAALSMTRESPWLGVGLGNYEVAYENHRLARWTAPLGHAHNYYLNIFAEAGFFGLVSYAGMWISIMFFTWQARQHPDFLTRCFCVGLLGTWTYLMVHSVLDNLYVNNMFLHIGVLLGLLLVVHQDIFDHKKRIAFLRLSDI